MSRYDDRWHEDGWTVQGTPPQSDVAYERAEVERVGGRILTESLHGTFHVCVLCDQMLDSPRTEDHDCPVLQGALPVRMHIPPAPFMPRPPEEQPGG